MTVPDLTLDVSGYCPRDRAQATFVPMQGYWECPVCHARWDHEGRNGRQVGAARPLITDRPTDSTSPTVLDQQQPD